jgi:signal-transduction protein with cAMP-binding, CBS, and nucleotidyltransferase domain
MRKIESYIKQPIVSVDRSLTVVEAQFHMQVKKVSSLLITAFQEYVGILTESDIDRKVLAKGLDPKDTLISSVMTRSVFSVDRFTSVEKAGEFMRQKGIGHLAVTREGRVVGVISFKDLAASYAQAFPALH